MIMLKKPKDLVIVNIDYYRLDFKNLLQMFVWQTEDIWPEIPRIHKFLNYWKDNIPATIANVCVVNTARRDFRNVSGEFLT